MPSKSPAKTRAELKQRERNIWTHLTVLLSPAERETIGISEDRAMDQNVLRALAYLVEARDLAVRLKADEIAARAAHLPVGFVQDPTTGLALPRVVTPR